MHFPTMNDGWAVGLNSKVVQTSDGGANWLGQSLGMEHDFDMRIFMSVHFVDNQIGWIVGQGGKVLKTSRWRSYLDCARWGLKSTNRRVLRRCAARLDLWR